MLFQLNKDNKELIRQAKLVSLADVGFLEKDLENLISKNISRFVPENQLMILAQEKPFDEAADIFALDQFGNLYIFELKRWQSNAENILQVLRYGQLFGQYSYDQLNEMLRSYRKDPDVDLAQKHFEYFQDVLKAKLSETDFNRDQHFVVVTNGIDEKTLNAISFWKSKGIKIDSLPYKVYYIGSEPFIEINCFNPENEVFYERQEGYFIVNTNVSWMADAYKDMLLNSKAAAYYDRKYSIMNIRKNDIVYLYHTGIGVIAAGKAVDDSKSKEVDGNPNEEYYIPLKFMWKVDPYTEKAKAIPPWEINAKMQSGYRFRQTVFSISEEMAKVIEEIQKKRQTK